jgi:hypothetical protein
LAPAWPYPQSRARTEALVRVPFVILLSCIYDEGWHAAFLANQFANIYERGPIGISIP